MASELRVNTLKDASGNNSVGMTYVAGGSAKAWVNFNGTGTVAIRNSLNTSTITDRTTGSYTQNYSSSWSAVDYTVTASGTSSANYSSAVDDTDGAPTTSATLIQTVTSSGTENDSPYALFVEHGDLA